MAKSRKIYIQGVKELVNLFEKIPDAAISVMDDAVKAGAEIPKQAAKQNVVKRTGKLASAIDTRPSKTKSETKKTHQVYIKGERQGGVRYGFAVETGTYKDPAQPFLRPAVDSNQSKIQDEVSEKISQGIGMVI